MIRFPCPGCGAPLKVPDDRAGRTVKCPECASPAGVPETLDDDPPAAELDEGPRRKVPVKSWAAVALIVAGLVACGVVAVVRSGPHDGLTRAERAALEAKMRRDLPGVWEATPVNGYSFYQGFYAFTDDGRFRAFKHAGEKTVTRYVGIWSVSGSTLTMRITEFVDEKPAADVSEQTIIDVRSEAGRAVAFGTAWAKGGNRHLTLARHREQPPPPPKPDPPLPPAPPAPADDGPTRDRGLAKWLVGRWTSPGPEGTWAWDFHLPLETSGLYRVKIFNGGREVGSFDGQWFVAAGQLTLTVRISFYEPMPANSSHLFDISARAPDGFALRTPLREYVTTLTRTK